VPIGAASGNRYSVGMMRTLERARYCRLADHKEWVRLADLFTEDASAGFYDPSGQIRSEINGRGEVARKIGTSVGAAQPIHHIFSAEFVISSPTEANAVWAMEDRLIQPEGAEASYRTMHGDLYAQPTTQRYFALYDRCTGRAT
jgi:hypothetical protein